MGFRKGMAAFGGGILFTCFFWSFLGLYIYRLQKRLGKIIEKCEELGAKQSTKLEIASEMRENENKKIK